MKLPNVACLMPTHGRAHMLPAALHGFLDQDYAGPATLYILDDSPEPWTPCCPSRPGREVVYAWDNAEAPQNCGAKRNRMMRTVLAAAALAPDESLVFALWDDDDLHGPARLRHQVTALLEATSAELCVLTGWILYDRRLHIAVRGTQMGADGTSVFTRAYWERAPWHERPEGYAGTERLTLQWHLAPERVVQLDDHPEDYAIIRHGANSTGEPSSCYLGCLWDAPCPVSANEIAARIRTAAACRSAR